MLIWRIVLICDEEAACVSVDPETSGRNKQSTQDYIQGKSQVKGKAHKNIENFNKKNIETPDAVKLSAFDLYYV